MKSAQDEINHRRSKALFYLNTRGVTLEAGAVDDVEKLRSELARPDRVVVVNPGKKVEYDDQAKFADMQGQLKFLEQSIAEIENYGPNQALVGQGGVENSSGRAISLLQQAGLSELGPFVAGYRGWKLRVYRAVWNLLQRFWTSERWIRVTDDEGVAQFVQLNGVGVGPNGMPATVNALGALDVDIILDEGPDTLTMEADTFQGLQALGPSFAQSFPDIALELLPGVQPSVKKKMLERMKEKQSQPPPEAQAAQAQMQMKQQDMQMRQQETMANLQLEQQKAEAETQRKQQEAAAGLQLKREEAQADIEIQRERNALDAQLQREKNMMQLELEREKAVLQIDLKRQTSQLELEFREMDATREDGRRAVERETEQQNGKAQSDGLGQAVVHLGTLIAETSRSTRDAITAPKRVVRDQRGQVSGVETVA
jgi:hypothetical protein